MKLRYIFTLLAAALTFSLVGCQEEEHFLDEVKVSSSYIGIPVEGGNVEITVTATDKWTITGIPDWFSVNGVSGEWVTETDKDGKETQKLVTGTFEGPAGESKVTFSAEAAEETREAIVYLNCSGAVQNINVIQLAEKKEVPVSPIKDVLAAEAGTFRIKGEVYGIYNTQYGNFYMKDGTGDILIYGCLDAEGKEKNFASLGIDNGDVITVEGPLKIYNGTWELVNVSVISIEKSLLKVDGVSYGEVAEGEEAPTSIALEGGSAVVTLTSKTGGVNVEIPEDAKSWLSVGGVNVDGTTVTVTLNAAENKLGDRTTTVTFTTKSGDKTYTAVADIAQKGAILEKTAKEINEAADGETVYRLTGYISKDEGKEYGNIYITDYTGTVYVYGVLDAEGQSKQWFNMGIKVGDIVTVEGIKTSYKENPQMKNVKVTKHIAVTPLSVADFTTKEDSKEVYYQLTGTVKNIVMDKNDATLQNEYGNFDLVDETGSIYVYGLLQGWGGPSKMFREMNIKEGDKLTIVGVHASYNGAAQVGSAFLVAHEEGTGEGGEETPALTIDGKQWLTNMDGMSFLVDLGASEEGILLFAGDEGGTGSYMPYYAGSYVTSATDATSGTIVFNFMDLETGEIDPEAISMSYSDLTETSVKVVSADFFGIEEAVAFTKASEYIEVALPGEGGGNGDVTPSSIESGDYWIVNSELQKVMAPLATSETEGYPRSEDMIDGASYAKNAFTFTYDADQSQYTIKDSYGRYVYSKADMSKLAVSAELPESGAYWIIEANADGTYDIYNGETYFTISYSTKYGSWEAKSIDASDFSGVYPTLVKADNPVAEPEGLRINPGANCSTDKATIDGTADVPVVKIGSSKNVGSFELVIPAGTKKLSCYAVCWNDLKKATVTISLNGTAVATQDVKPNAGAKGSSPYTITSTAEDKYTFDFPVETETTVTVSSDKRVIFWGLSAE